MQFISKYMKKGRNNVSTPNISHLKRDRYKAIMLLAASSVLWSTGGILIKMVNWNPVAIAGMRSAIAAAMILIVIKKPPRKWSLNQVAGAIAYATTLLLFVWATKMTTAANAVLLQYTAPIYVALFGAWMLGERTTLIDWITVFAVIGGMVLFFLDSVSAGGFMGNIMAILSGVSFAGMHIFMRKQKDESPIQSIFLGNIILAVVALPFMFKSMPDTRSWAGLAALGVIQIGLPYILYSIAIKSVTALEAVLIPVVEPLLNPLWVFLFMGEVPGVWAFVGGFIVLFFVTARCVLVSVRSEKAAGIGLEQGS